MSDSTVPGSAASQCGCRPGTYEDGWHEVRSERCLAAEREAFFEALSFIPLFKQKMTREEVEKVLNLRRKALDRVPRYRIT